MEQGQAAGTVNMMGGNDMSALGTGQHSEGSTALLGPGGARGHGPTINNLIGDAASPAVYKSAVGGLLEGAAAEVAAAQAQAKFISHRLGQLRAMYGVSDGASEGGKQDDSGGGTGGKKKKHVLSPEQEAEWKARLEDEWCKLPEQEKTPFYLYKKDGLGDTAERNPALAPPSADKGKGGGGGTRYNELLHAEKGTVNPLDYTAHMPCPLPAAAAYEQEIRSLNDALRQVRRRRKRRQEKRQMKQMTRQMTRQMTIEENTTCVYDFCVDRCVAYFSQPCILIYRRLFSSFPFPSFFPSCGLHRWAML